MSEYAQYKDMTFSTEKVIQTIVTESALSEKKQITK